MERPPAGRRLLAVLTVLTLTAAGLPGFAAPAVSVRGTILSAGSSAPARGAVMHAFNLRTGAAYRSAPADDGGGFVLEGLPAATYELAAEVEGGLFPIDRPVAIAPGKTRLMNVVLEDTPQVPPSEGTITKAKRPKKFSNPLVATGLVLGSAIVLGLLADALEDGGNPGASPSNP